MKLWTRRQGVYSRIGVDGAAAACCSVYDVTVNTSKLHAHALDGMAHFMDDSIITSTAGDKAWRQMVHKYKGYTGEEAVFDSLESSGHVIDIPESATTAGYDLVLDGNLFNVKITGSLSYIREHLEKNPDIDIITNIEMAEVFSNNPRVIIDAGISSQEMFHITAETLDGISSLGNFINCISVRNGSEISWTYSAVIFLSPVLKKTLHTGGL